MRKLLLLLAMLPWAAFAQTPDEDRIIDRTMDSESPYYYPNLMLRYNAGDTTLTADDYHYLYYGYAYQDAYKPLDVNPDLDRTLLIASRIDTQQPARDDPEALIASADDALARDPFSPKLLNLMAFSYGALGDTIRERAYYDRMQKVIATIEASGDGLTQKNPQHILMFDHAVDVLTAAGLPAGKSRVVSRTVEYVPLVSPYTVDGRKVKGYYFDFSRIYRNKPEGYTFQRDRTWQFNNLKPRTYK